MFQTASLGFYSIWSHVPALVFLEKSWRLSSFCTKLVVYIFSQFLYPTICFNFRHGFAIRGISPAHASLMSAAVRTVPEATCLSRSVLPFLQVECSSLHCSFGLHCSFNQNCSFSLNNACMGCCRYLLTLLFSFKNHTYIFTLSVLFYYLHSNLSIRNIIIFKDERPVFFDYYSKDFCPCNCFWHKYFTLKCLN